MDFAPQLRVSALTAASIRIDGDYVLYWMTAFRRTQHNFALQHAVAWANKLEKPLIVFEAVRTNYRWACDRFTSFIIDGMIDNATAVEKTKAFYYGYVEPHSGAGEGLAKELMSRASITVGDDFPCFFHPAMYQRIVKRWNYPCELVDSNGILPMRAADRTFTVAHSFRRFMQKEILNHLDKFPVTEPLKGLKKSSLRMPVAEWIQNRWQCLGATDLEKVDVAKLPIDHAVKAVDEKGGAKHGINVLNRFLSHRLDDYERARNEPEEHGSSWLSPYLHFGFVSSHRIFEEIAARTLWTPDRMGKPNGRSSGFWNMDTNEEAFLDQIITWREVGYNMCHREHNYDRYESLPSWARETLENHQPDPRPQIFSLEQLDRGATYDPLWNAAQVQLVRIGRIHNYMRMLWGKKILQWTRSPQEALSFMIQLNNKYALDGRNPNSYSGIFWVLGRYDRAWGPERPIFGKIRYMTSESTANKYHVKKYIREYASIT